MSPSALASARARTGVRGTVKQGAHGAPALGDSFASLLDLSRPIQTETVLAAPKNRYGYRLSSTLGLIRAVEHTGKAEHAPECPRSSSSLSTPSTALEPGATARTARAIMVGTWLLCHALNSRSDQFRKAGHKAWLTRTATISCLFATGCGVPARKMRICSIHHADALRDRLVDRNRRYTSLSSGVLPMKPSRWLPARKASDLIGAWSSRHKANVLARCLLLDMSQSGRLGSASQSRRSAAAPI